LLSRLSPKDREDAICYAKRYSDIFKGFCGEIETKCFESDLLLHYEETGRDDGLVWGCLTGMEEDALCYAMRYPDLFQAYCNSKVDQCDFLGLYVHYRDFGIYGHLLWSCRRVKTKVSNADRLLPTLPSLFVNEELRTRPKISKVHLLVFETDSARLAGTPIINQIVANSFKSWLSYEVLGIDTNFKGFSTKWMVLKHYLQDNSFNEETFLLIVDARDSLLNLLPHRQIDGASTIDRLSMMVDSVTNGNHNAVIMSAEGQCCVAALTFVKPGDYFNPDGTRNVRACSSGSEGCIWNGDSEKVEWEDAMIHRCRETNLEKLATLDSFLNAGLVGGFPNSIDSLLTLADVSCNLHFDTPV
jgi:hypothetical protein